MVASPPIPVSFRRADAQNDHPDQGGCQKRKMCQLLFLHRLSSLLCKTIDQVIA